MRAHGLTLLSFTPPVRIPIVSTVLCALILLSGCGTTFQYRGKVTVTHTDGTVEKHGAYAQVGLAGGSAHVDKVVGSYTNEKDASGFMEDFRHNGEGLESTGEKFITALSPLIDTAIKAYFARPTTSTEVVTNKTTLQDLLKQLTELGLLKGSPK